jgi:holo-[acyl-carrier protein] synthase
MIAGIGTDIVEIKRIQKSIEKHSQAFLDQVFTTNEIEYCQQKANPYESFAARFAAKEALLKAIGTGLRYEFKFTEIDVQKDDKGAPFIILSGAVKKYYQELTIQSIHLSLSHTKYYAQAFVILEK